MSSSPYINRFLQPDTLIPDPANPQAFNRYVYVANNPIVRNDPTGHAWNDCKYHKAYCAARDKNRADEIRDTYNAIKDLLSGGGDEKYCTDIPGGKTCLWELEWTPSDTKYKDATPMVRDFLRDLGNSSGVDNVVGFLGIVITVLSAVSEKIPTVTPALVAVRQYAIDQNYAQIRQFEQYVNSYIDHNPDQEIRLTISYTERMDTSGYIREGAIAFEVVNDPSQNTVAVLLEQPALRAYFWLSANVGE